MIDDFDETEIKIEYNESFETDPLCHEIHISDENAITKNEKTVQINWYKSINDVGNYVCLFCERIYTCIPTLRFHVKAKHPDEAAIVKSYMNKRRRTSKHRCHLCKSRFLSITELKEHVENIHGYENIAKSCLLCNGSFNTLEELTDHLLCHHHVRHKTIYICKVCGYRTYKTNRFVNHKYVHMEQKTYKCQSCDYCTSHLNNLTRHEKIHAKDKLKENSNMCDGDRDIRCKAQNTEWHHRNTNLK